MDDFPLQIVDKALSLGNTQFYTYFHFRVPSRMSLDKGLTTTKVIERVCNIYQLKLLNRNDYNQLQIDIDSGLYANGLEQDPVLPWEILQIVFASVTELESLLAIRNACKSTLLFFDTHVDEIWHNVCLHCVPYRKDILWERLLPIHTLNSFLKHYYRIYYTRRIDRFIGLEDALQFHLIHGNLDLFIKQANTSIDSNGVSNERTQSLYAAGNVCNVTTLGGAKLGAQQIARLAVPYLRDEQAKQFAEHFSGSLFYAVYYFCAHEEQKVYYKASVFLEYEFTPEQVALLLACALQKERVLITRKLCVKLKEKGLFSKNGFYRLINGHSLTKTFDCQKLSHNYLELCGPLLPLEQDYTLIITGLAFLSLAGICYYYRRYCNGLSS